jgi:hypothetical protein
MKLSHFYLVALAISIFAAGCAHGPKTAADPKLLLSQACDIGRENQGVKGTAWLKAKSKEASGQFPAVVVAKAPDQLRLEVTNLIGGVEAIIEIKGATYKIEGARTKIRKEQNSSGYWGGIPLQWATDLFLGRIPCPAKSDVSDATMKVTSEGDLVVETAASLGAEAERFTYRFKTWGGKPWPETLHWQRLGTLPLAVDFKFEDPEDKSNSPKKWEAKSLSGHGEVKMRWKDRDVTR